MSTRQNCNKAILEILSKEIEKYPWVRFGQLLRNLNIIDEHKNSEGSIVGWSNEFFTESSHTLSKIPKREHEDDS